MALSPKMLSIMAPSSIVTIWVLLLLSNVLLIYPKQLILRRNPLIIMRRNRAVYSVMIGLVMIMGLSTRRYGDLFPQIISNYGGDVLWALMVFLIFSSP